MGQYLIDNNVISSYFANAFTEKAMNFVTDIIDQTPTVSVITEIEALSWINPDKLKEHVVKEFIQDANVLPLIPAIVKQCVIIRRSKKIKTPDAIIAATAIVHKLTLITSDTDFNNIANLNVIDPNKL